MIERTLVIVKPEHLRIGSQILQDLDPYGWREQTVFLESVDADVAALHCLPHAGRDYHPRLLRQFSSRAVILGVYSGENVITLLDHAVGPTDPQIAPPDTIRGKYSVDTLARAIEEDRALQNVVHCSRTPQEAKQDLQVWERYLNF